MDPVCRIFLLTTLSITSHPMHALVNVSIVAVLPNVKSPVALPYLGAPIELAVDDVNRSFKHNLNITLHFLSLMELPRGCAEAKEEEMRLVAEFYYGRPRSTCTVIIGTSCGALYDYAKSAREWDVAVFSTSMVSTQTYNRKYFSTTISMAATFDRYAQGILQVLQHYGWLHVALLIDKGTTLLVYSEIGDALKLAVAKQDISIRVQLDIMYIDCQKTNTIIDALYRVRQNNRGKFGCISVTNPGSCKEKVFDYQTAFTFYVVYGVSVVVLLGMQATSSIQTLKTAKLLDMTNGNYAYINFQPLTQDLYGVVSQFSQPSTEERRLFQSLLFISTDELTQNISHVLNTRIRNLAISRYPNSFRNETRPLDLYPVQSAYESVEVIAQAINESYPLLGDRACSGTFLTNSVSGRKFNLTNGDIYVDKEGGRDIALAVYGFSLVKNSMQKIAVYDVNNRSLNWLMDVAVDWPNGTPPLDAPVCGLKGTDGPCETIVSSALMAGVACLVVVAIFVLSGYVAFCLRKFLFPSFFETKWWLLSVKELVFTDPIFSSNFDCNVKH